MADITAELEEILEAIRGEDVRQSIYRGLLKMNNQVVSNDTLVEALNEAITAETGTNVRSFVERVKEAIKTAGCYSDDGTGTTIETALRNLFYPALLIRDPSTGDSLSFSVDLPKPFAELESNEVYRVVINDMRITYWGAATNIKTIVNFYDGAPDPLFFDDYGATIGRGNHLAIDLTKAISAVSSRAEEVCLVEIDRLNFTFTKVTNS